MSSAPLTVLAVGATGSIGRLVVQVAAERGDHVVAVVRPGSDGCVPDEAEIVHDDLGDPASLHLPDVDAPGPFD